MLATANDAMKKVLTMFVSPASGRLRDCAGRQCLQRSWYHNVLNGEVVIFK
jgi:hypothetical protein